MMLSGGKHAVRKLKREPKYCWRPMLATAMTKIACTVAVGGSTVYRTKRRFVEGNLERAPSEEPRPGAERKLTGKEEGLAGGNGLRESPAGSRPRWTLELLADAMVKLHRASKSLSHETVRAAAGRKRHQALGARTCGAFPKSTANMFARMEDVLDLLCRSAGPQATSRLLRRKSRSQLIGEVRQAIPAKPGQLERYDYEYRHATAPSISSSSSTCIVPGGRSRSPSGARREDYAQCMRQRTRRYPLSPCRVHPGRAGQPLDPLGPAPSMKAFPPAEARRMLAPLGVPLHSQARLLAQHGRNRDRRPARPVSGSQNRRPKSASAARSPLGSEREMPPAPASNGCSQPTKPAPKWAALTPTRRKSHNHCEWVLVPLMVSARPRPRPAVRPPRLRPTRRGRFQSPLAVGEDPAKLGLVANLARPGVMRPGQSMSPNGGKTWICHGVLEPSSSAPFG